MKRTLKEVELIADEFPVINLSVSDEDSEQEEEELSVLDSDQASVLDSNPDSYPDSDSDAEDPEAEDPEAEDSDTSLKTLESRFLVRRARQLPEIEANYNSDTSDDEHTNTIGNVPVEWYNDYPHIGYDKDGNKLMRPAKGDDLDRFLASMDDKDAWRSVYDKLEGKDIVLNKEELEMLKRIQLHQFPESAYDPFEPSVDYFSGITETMPISAAPEPKRRFIPSKMEASKIMKIARAIKAGIIVPGRKKKTESPKIYDIWANAEEVSRPNHIPAPKLKLPEHNESYNPPSEYILDDKEEKEWRELDEQDRPHKFLPKIHDALRKVGAYPKFIQERFERCLDLYLAPRAIKQKLDIDPESLIPKLPSPKDLRPFPTKLSISYKGHTGRVRTISVDPTGQWLASGSDDCTVKVWEVSTGRCINTFFLDEAVMWVSWNPNKSLSLLAACHGSQVSLLNPNVANDIISSNTEEIIADTKEMLEQNAGKATVWEKPSANEKEIGHYLNLKFQKNVTSVVWHRKGDYFASVSPASNSTAVQIHQLSKATSQSPFKKSIGQVQKVIFHPSRPILFVATQQSVRVYNLVKQEMIKKLMPGAKWISSIDIHPNGDNVIIGTYDKRIHWFDMDLSMKPYKTLRYHHQAVRQVAFHPRYPLFASSSDDGTVLLFHGMVYNDLMQNPLIVPLKTLKGHKTVNSLGVLDCAWHPTQPWIFSSGADKSVKLFI